MYTTMTRLINAPSYMPTAEALALAEMHSDDALDGFLRWNDDEYECAQDSGEFDTPDRAALVDMTVTALTGVPYGACAS
jgi:hypothetical protein